MKTGRTKEFLQALLQSAHDLVNAAGGVGAIDGLEGKEHGKMMRSLYRQLRESHDVIPQTARKYIAQAMRRERYKVMQDPAKMEEYKQARGGVRAGAGKKKADKYASWTTTDYGEVPFYLIATAPTQEELNQRVEAYFEKPNSYALFEQSNERRGTIKQYQAALLKQQKHIFAIKNH